MTIAKQAAVTKLREELNRDREKCLQQQREEMELEHRLVLEKVIILKHWHIFKMLKFRKKQLLNFLMTQINSLLSTCCSGLAQWSLGEVPEVPE